ncbi:hypothetical protein CULT_2170004 [[Clostridium] ultunense Esp]|nr:hypothetical protein CULT_2170004 [[Clostridium] ultunense Esp]
MPVVKYAVIVIIKMKKLKIYL